RVVVVGCCVGADVLSLSLSPAHRGHCSWLQLDRRVLEHDFPRKSGPIVLHFCVKFYIESIAYLKHNATIELFFLNAKSCIYKVLSRATATPDPTSQGTLAPLTPGFDEVRGRGEGAFSLDQSVALSSLRQ
uniref:FERM domain-containing protein n=1 Tax=Callorhinchus milii TaxID=7868 RepID=A0A4W3H295_CALMI